MADIIHYYASMPLIEWLAVLFSALYVILAARNNIWCWPAAIASTVIYTAIFYDVYLWMDSFLQVYYLLMAVYGWSVWYFYHKNIDIQMSPQGMKVNKPMKSLSLAFNFIAIGLLSITSLLVGWLMANYTPTHFPYIDSFTTIFALFATYLVTQKVVENWLYWIVIDLVSIYLYLEKSLAPTALLFGFYVIIAVYGYVKWRNISINENLTVTSTSTPLVEQ